MSFDAGFHNIDNDTDLILLSAPDFVRNHDRSGPAKSSLTVQIDLRIFYASHALNLIQN